MQKQLSVPALNEPISPHALAAFAARLTEEERADGTIENYVRTARQFSAFLAGKPPTREAVLHWKAALCSGKIATATANAQLSALNRFLCFLGFAEYRVALLRQQRRMFRPQQRQLTRAEYKRLLRAARDKGDARLALMLETICSTGIRVSELTFITAQAARQGRAEIRLKGKIRIILLPRQLCTKLTRYADRQGIDTGAIFRTRTGAPVGRRQIWRQMKALCRAARVAACKVFPHNLRHLFATTFYAASRDIARLADVLGHSSLETTRIYLVTSGCEHRRILDQLRLIC